MAIIDAPRPLCIEELNSAFNQGARIEDVVWGVGENVVFGDGRERGKVTHRFRNDGNAACD